MCWLWRTVDIFNFHRSLRRPGRRKAEKQMPPGSGPRFWITSASLRHSKWCHVEEWRPGAISTEEDTETTTGTQLSQMGVVGEGGLPATSGPSEGCLQADGFERQCSEVHCAAVLGTETREWLRALQPAWWEKTGGRDRSQRARQSIQPAPRSNPQLINPLGKVVGIHSASSLRGTCLGA